MRLRQIAKMIVITGLVLYGLLCTALFVFQRSLIYYPRPRLNVTDSVLLNLPVDAMNIHVSVRPHNSQDAVIYFGGNAEDVSQDIPDLSAAFPGSAIYGLHYPGYGGSSGAPTQKTIFAAALALFDHVYPEHANVTVIGRSLGSGVAVWIASQRPAARLVLITPFDRFADPASGQYPFVPVRWLLRDRFESGRYAPLVNAPTRIIVAAGDELVPRESSERLRSRFQQGLVSYTVIPQAGHNTIQESADYWQLLAQP